MKCYENSCSRFRFLTCVNRQTDKLMDSRSDFRLSAVLPTHQTSVLFAIRLSCTHSGIALLLNCNCSEHVKFVVILGFEICLLYFHFDLCFAIYDFLLSDKSVNSQNGPTNHRWKHQSYLLCHVQSEEKVKQKSDNSTFCYSLRMGECKTIKACC